MGRNSSYSTLLFDSQLASQRGYVLKERFFKIETFRRVVQRWDGAGITSSDPRLRVDTDPETNILRRVGGIPSVLGRGQSQTTIDPLPIGY